MQPSQHHVSLFNILIPFLAKRDIGSLAARDLQRISNRPQADLLILLGNSSLYVAEQAASAYRQGLAKELLICGGIGHSTHYLEANIRQHPVYNSIEVGDRPEADMLRDILVKHWGIAPGEILLENRSTNCGGNATEARKVLEQLHKKPQTILLLQDPVLQRRTQASFEKAWEPLKVQFISHAAFVPLLQLKGGKLAFANEAHRAFCGIDRFLSLVMGEIPRLRNDAKGYGPNGSGFITAVDIPAEVEEAYTELADIYGLFVRA
ncbi:YdcF family protein [Pontibacter saemangeumensis]|uniref:YdcF family protein n=1 Tax=Pontibacter saemangeumensis TaxID=1084525 RepID=A0ABP8M1N6_9BACT